MSSSVEAPVSVPSLNNTHEQVSFACEGLIGCRAWLGRLRRSGSDMRSSLELASPWAGSGCDQLDNLSSFY